MSDARKYLDDNGLKTYDSNIKGHITDKVNELAVQVAFIDIESNATVITEEAIQQRMEEIENGTY